MRLVSASGDPGGKESDHRHRRLLRACPERPRDRCAAEQCDEFPALQGLPSSDGTPQTTTPLRENAAVHHSKIDRRMAEMVKTSKAQQEHMISGLPPIADLRRAARAAGQRLQRSLSSYEREVPVEWTFPTAVARPRSQLSLCLLILFHRRRIESETIARLPRFIGARIVRADWTARKAPKRKRQCRL